MPILTININMDVVVDYFENKTDLTEEQISKKVWEYVENERNLLAMEARIAAIKILDGEL